MRRPPLEKAKKWSSEGFTLIEMVVTFALIAILGTALATLLVPALNIYTSSMDLSQSRLIAASVADAIDGNLAFADKTNVTIAPDGKSVSFISPRYGNMIIKQTDDGRLAVLAGCTRNDDGTLKEDGVDIGFDINFYMGKSVDLSLSRISEDTVLVNITVLRNGNNLTSTSTAIKILN